MEPENTHALSDALYRLHAITDQWGGPVLAILLVVALLTWTGGSHGFTVWISKHIPWLLGLIVVTALMAKACL